MNGLNLPDDVINKIIMTARPKYKYMIKLNRFFKFVKQYDNGDFYNEYICDNMNPYLSMIYFSHNDDIKNKYGKLIYF